MTVEESARQLPEGSTLVSCDEHEGTSPLRSLELRLWKVPQEGGEPLWLWEVEGTIRYRYCHRWGQPEKHRMVAERKAQALITKIMTGAGPRWWRKAIRGA